MDRLLQGWDNFDEIKQEVDSIRSQMKTPMMIYFDSMASVARFFNISVSTVKSAVNRGTSMRNGYKVSRIDVLYNLDEKRGRHLNLND
jgi:hypothetical protein